MTRYNQYGSYRQTEGYGASGYGSYGTSGYGNYGAGGYGTNAYGNYGYGNYGYGNYGYGNYGFTGYSNVFFDLGFGIPQLYGGLSGYGSFGSSWFPVLDFINTPGDVSPSPYEADDLTWWLLVRAGGSFTGVFEDTTSTGEFSNYSLRSVLAKADTTDVTFRGPNLPEGPVTYLFPDLTQISLDSTIPGSPEIGSGNDKQVVGTDLLFQNFGGSYFAPNLQTIDAKATATVDVTFENKRQQDENGDNLDVFGDGFMRSLRSVQLKSRDENAAVSFSNDGGNDFMPSLRTISVKAKEFAGVSISASVNPSPLADNSLGNGFMRSLKSIRVIAEEAEASLSISYSGGAEFMESLESIYMYGGGTSEIASVAAVQGVSLSFSVSLDNEGTDSVEFMRSLKTITVLSPVGETTVSISVSGGDLLFMPSLERILINGANHAGDASFSISHEVLVEDENVAAFMQSLKTITLIGENAGASVSISVATEAMYFESLEEIHVAGDGNADLTIRNGAADDFAPQVTSLNVELIELRDVFEETPGAVIELENWLREGEFADAPGDNFMASLQTIALKSIGLARLKLENGFFEPDEPIEVPGGEYFLSALETVDVEAGLDADVLLHTAGDNAFQSLTSVHVIAQRAGALTLAEATSILDMVIDDGEEEDRSLSEIIVDGEGATNAFGALEEINVTVEGAGPLGLVDEGSLFVHLDNIASAAFDVLLETNGNGDIEVEANDTPGLETLALTGDSMASLLLTGAQTGFSLLDLTGMALGSETTADMTGATFGGGFDVRLGSGNLDYAAGGVSETFVFTDDMLGTLNFSGFDTAASGDLLDLSALGVADLGELDIDDSGADLEITSTDGDFIGSIVLVGVDNAIDVTDNFVFTI